jgi:hypothetical protein
MNVRDYPTLKLVRKEIDVNERERLSNTKVSKKGY